MTKSAIGIDIGGTHLRAARISADGAILARARLASARESDVVMARLCELIQAVDDPDVAAIGIGVPGRVDFSARTVLSGGYVDLSGTRLVDDLEGRFGRRVVIDNDCSMALVGEARCGAARGARNAVMLTIGTGIGGAVLDRGRIVRGQMAAGQLGHVVVVPEGRLCACGRRGCVETESSGTALGRHIAEAGLPAGTTAAQLLADRAGDAQADSVLRAWSHPLRRAVDSLVATLDPELVVLGGGLGREAVAALAGTQDASAWFGSRLVAAELGDDAGVIGAGLAALAGAGQGKRLLMVNGVPASGKSTVARMISTHTGWPVLALDTIKNPFLQEIETVDRPFNRVLGRAAYRAIFALIAEAPDETTAIVDAWFGFQPAELLEQLIAEAGIAGVAEIWCSTDPEAIGQRYRDRAATRLPGHPGADYADELVVLAGKAEPMGIGPVLRLDTGAAPDMGAIDAFLSRSRFSPER